MVSQAPRSGTALAVDVTGARVITVLTSTRRPAWFKHRRIG